MRFLRTTALVALMGLVLAGPASAAGTVVVTSAEVRAGNETYIRYTVAWTSTAGGAVSSNGFAVVPGRLTNIRMTPGATTPSDLYDVTLSDGTVTDLLAGRGTDMSNAASTLLQWDPALFQDGTRTLDVVIANAGNAKTGTVILMIKTLDTF